jgi:hypothetical protein
MTVAEMPGDADQVVRVGAADLQERLGRGDHLDQPPIFQHQRVAATQGDRVLEIEQELQSARARHRHPPAVAVVEIEHDGIGRRLGPAVLRFDGCRTDHAGLPSLRS